MVIIAAFDQGRLDPALLARAMDPASLAVADFGAVRAGHDPVAILEIGHVARQRRQRNRIGAEIHLPLAIAQDQRAAPARAQKKTVFLGKHRGNGKGAGQPRERFLERLHRVQALVHTGAEQLGDRLAVGLGLEDPPLLFHLAAQRLEILDDPVMHDRRAAAEMGMGIGRVRAPVRGPAGMGDAGRPLERVLADRLAQRRRAILPAARRRSSPASPDIARPAES
jgi:hypothetical protein